VKLSIQPDPIHFYNGGNITGFVHIESHESFTCDVLHLILHANEEIRFTQKSGKEWSETTKHFQKDIVLGRDKIMNQGTTRVPFSIEIPYDAPPSFNGHLGRCVYTLEIRMITNISEIQSDTREIWVRSNISMRNPNPIHISKNSADVQFEKDLFCIGEQISFNFKLLEDTRLTSLNIELHRTETAVVGIIEGTWSRKVERMTAEIDNLDLMKGINVEFDTFLLKVHTYQGKNLHHDLYLHLKFGTLLKEDKTIIIPITLVECPKAF